MSLQEVLTQIRIGHFDEAIRSITKETIVGCANDDIINLIVEIIFYSDASFDDPSFMFEIDLEKIVNQPKFAKNKTLIAFLWLNHKPKCARYVKQLYPHLLNTDLFSECIRDYHLFKWTHAFIFMLDEGYYDALHIECGNAKIHVAEFICKRERARERALILLWLPPKAGAGAKITKDVARIIARVVWAMRKFN